MEDNATLVAPHADEVPDSALLVAFANGDAQAGRQLVARLGPMLFGYAARVLGDQGEAEDVVQETMLRLWKMAPDWRQGEAKVSTWTYRVTMNLCTDRLRQRQARPQVALDSIVEPAADLATVVDLMSARQRSETLDAALAVLPDRQRQAVVMRHLEGFSNPEIAEIMDIGVEAVESLTARGKRALKKALYGKREELGFEDDRKQP